MQYFEATLQLRSPQPEEIAFVRSVFEKNKDERIFISKVKKLKNGIDFFISNKRFALKIAKYLQENYGGELKVSKKIHTRDRQTGKDVYRLAILFKSVNLKKGDIIAVEDKVLRIGSVGNKISGTNLNTGKKVLLPITTKFEKLDRKKTEVTKQYPQLEVLNPESYESSKLENSKKLKIGEKVEVALHNGKLYLA